MKAQIITWKTNINMAGLVNESKQAAFLYAMNCLYKQQRHSEKIVNEKMRTNNTLQTKYQSVNVQLIYIHHIIMH